MDLLIHHHRLHKDMLPTEIAQMQDGSNAFNEMEPCAIAEGIATAPIVHRAFYNYFISATIDPTPSSLGVGSMVALGYWTLHNVVWPLCVMILCSRGMKYSW